MSSSLDPPTLASTSSSSSLIDGLDDDNSDKHAPSFTTDPGLVGLNGHGLQQLQLQQLVFSEQSNRHNAAANSAIKLSSVPAAPEMNDTESCSTTSTVTEASTPQRPAAAALSQPQNISPNPAQIPIQIQFRSHTIAPSPPLPRTSPEPTAESVSTAPHNNPSEVTPGIHHHTLSHNTTPGGPLGGSNLRIQTEFHPATPRTSSPEPRHAFATPTPTKRPALSLQPKTSSSSLRPISRTPSLKTPNFGNPFGSASAASSTVPSPVISAMGDVTPLPSPLLSNDSPGPWRKLGRRISREGNPFSPVSAEGDPHASTPTPMAQNKRKTYAGLSVGNGVLEGGAEQLDGASSQVSAHTRNRSISEYIPDPMLIPKRMSTVSGPRIPRVDLKNVKAGMEVQGHMRREPHLSEARGLTPIEKPPTPPPSESSLSANESSAIGSGSSTSSIQPAPEYFEAHGRRDNKRRRWRAIKQLGQGTFSRVMLATSQVSPSSSMLLSDDEDCSPGTTGGPRSLDPVTRYERRTLVAVKVCEHGPRGGASEDRIEMSLKRELEIMQSIHHPCLVHLKAWNIEMTRAILVLSYCPGGDLFDVASQHRDVLSPGLLRRMFAELIGAVGYLHELKIVHRDIKLESKQRPFPSGNEGYGANQFYRCPCQSSSCRATN